VVTDVIKVNAYAATSTAVQGTGFSQAISYLTHRHTHTLTVAEMQFRLFPNNMPLSSCKFKYNERNKLIV